MPFPAWALPLAFWLHMLATVIWVGGLAALALIVLPTLRRSLKPRVFANWLTTLNKRLDPIGWFSLGLLTFTGLVQMEANPSYVGLLAVSNAWSQAILFKHIVFVGMIAVSAYVTWKVAPEVQRSALKQARGIRDGSDQYWQARLQQFIGLNLFLALLVLVFTAIARTS